MLDGEPRPARGSQRREDRLIAAFARTATHIAWEGPLQVVLDHLANEVLAVSCANTCAIGLRSRLGDSLEMVGAAGYPAGYLDRLDEARSLGAPLVTLRALGSRAPVIGKV